MKETTLWKCDICGTEYRDKKQCQKCESNHKKEGKIDLLSHIYSREILFTSICWFRKEEADSTNFSSASVV